jgi:hypothetical protein
MIAGLAYNDGGCLVAEAATTCRFLPAMSRQEAEVRSYCTLRGAYRLVMAGLDWADDYVQNCVKAFTANTCTYNRHGTLPASSKQEQIMPASAANNAPFNSLEDLQCRMAKIEELLGVARAHHSSATQRVENTAPSTPLPLLGMVVVNGDRSHYHGQTDRVTLLDQVCIIVLSLHKTRLTTSSSLK